MHCDFDIFSDKISHLDKDLIALVKEQITFRIDKWIKSNPYDLDYFTPSKFGFKVLYGPEIDDMTYGLMNYIWYTFAIYTGDPKVTFQGIKDILETDTGFFSNREDISRLIPKPLLEKAKEKLTQVIAQETDISKINIYQNTISAIDVYLDMIAERKKVRSLSRRPTQDSLRNLFDKDEGIRAYLKMNLISRDLGFDPLFFDWLDDSLLVTGSYAIHHRDKARYWSVYIRDLMITSVHYHKLYDSAQISAQDRDILLKGMNMLIELGVDSYKKGAANWEITEQDIENVFIRLGGGTLYTLTDGRTVLDWWKEGSVVGRKIKSDNAFSDRLKAFNNRVQFLVDSNHDYEKWLNKFYPISAPNWIVKGKAQMDSFEWMAENMKHLHYLVHLEDINFVRDTWGRFSI